MNRRELIIGAMAARLSLASSPKPGSELIGQPAPPLKLDHWLNSGAIDMADLRGKVVLLRWWTEGCPFCTATAPALLDLERAYGPKGLQVIGVYHPKPPGDWSMERMKEAVQEKRFDFPVALDGNWTALKRWWLTRDRDFTSVSFLVDRAGIIRYVHPGGEYHDGDQGGMPNHEQCNRDLQFIRAEVGRLLG